MQPGEEKTVNIPPEEAFGLRVKYRIIKVGIEAFPASIIPKPGLRIELEGLGGSVIQMKMIDMDDENVTVDTNHPLAGETLTDDVRLIEILS